MIKSIITPRILKAFAEQAKARTASGTERKPGTKCLDPIDGWDGSTWGAGSRTPVFPPDKFTPGDVAREIYLPLGPGAKYLSPSGIQGGVK